MFGNWIDESESDRKNVFYNNSVVSVRQWMATFMIMLIPLVNIVMLFRWAFANKEVIPTNIVNWARASIIIFTMAILAVMIIVGFLYLGAVYT